MIVKNILISTCCVFLFFLEACDKGVEKNKTSYKGGPYYFKGFESKKHRPELPLHQISEADALTLKSKRTAYIIAFFRPDGQLLSIESRLGEDVQWRSEYQYKDDGKIVSGYLIHPDGRKKYEFDQSGKQIYEVWFDLNGKEVAHF